MSSAHERPLADPETTESEEPAADNDVSPEVHLLVMLGVGGWIAAIAYVGVHYPWPWAWVLALGPFVALIVKGKVWPSEDPADERRAERDRQINELNDYIVSLGGHEDTEKSEETQQAIQDARLRQIDIYNEYLEAERAHRAAKAPSRPLSAPRRVLRWISKGLILLIMIPLAIVFYGSLLLGPPLLVFGASTLVMDTQWAWIPAGLTVPLSAWFVWWWINRASDSTVRIAGAGMAAGAGFGGGGGS